VLPTLRISGDDVLFAHWPVDAAALEAAVPEPLTVETFDGDAWLTILCHEVTEATLDAVPVSPLAAFGEVDLRTYVRFDGDPGVYFFSCNTGQALNSLLGERAFGLPHRRATIDIDRHNGRVILRAAQSAAGGGRYDVTYRPMGTPQPADPESLADFLVERHTYFTPTEGDATSTDSMLIGSIERDPWQLASVDASIRTNTMFETASLDAPTAAPTFHYSPGFTSLFVDREVVALG
jgi:hypothetical protein